MPHVHNFSHHRQHTTLSLPDTTQRYELLTAHFCVCGASRTSTSWSKAQGRHLDFGEAHAVQRREKARPQRRTT